MNSRQIMRYKAFKAVGVKKPCCGLDVKYRNIYMRLAGRVEREKRIERLAAEMEAM